MSEERAMTRFNERYPVGTPVRYWPGVREGEGRESVTRTPAWLEYLGYDRPREDHVVVQLTYVSQLLRMAPDALHEQGFVIGPVPGRPHGLRGDGQLPLRGRRRNL